MTPRTAKVCRAGRWVGQQADLVCHLLGTCMGSGRGMQLCGRLTSDASAKEPMRVYPMMLSASVLKPGPSGPSSCANATVGSNASARPKVGLHLKLLCHSIAAALTQNQVVRSPRAVAFSLRPHQKNTRKLAAALLRTSMLESPIGLSLLWLWTNHFHCPLQQLVVETPFCVRHAHVCVSLRQSSLLHAAKAQPTRQVRHHTDV